MAPEVAREPGQILLYMAPWIQVTELRLFTRDIILDHLDGMHVIQGSLSEEAEGQHQRAQRQHNLGLEEPRSVPASTPGGHVPWHFRGELAPSTLAFQPFQTYLGPRISRTVRE